MKDIDEIRRENLRIIERENGGPSGVANIIGMSPAQFTNLRNGAKDSKTGKPRGMRKSTARSIEEKCGKPEGWLDIDHGQEADARKEEPREVAAWEAYSRADDATKAIVDAILGVGKAPPWLNETAAGFIEVLKASAKKWIRERKKTKDAA
ncbi:hypothetical protein [Pandoraea communis]|nr:hypothetical protein [Pandoraea communis]